jgi:hypothetical protein
MLGAGDFTEHLMEALAYVGLWLSWSDAYDQPEIIEASRKSVQAPPHFRS